MKATRTMRDFRSVGFLSAVAGMAFLFVLLAASSNGQPLVQPKSESRATATESPSTSNAGQNGSSNVVVARVNRQPIYLSEVLRITAPRERNLIVRPDGTRWDDVKAVRLRELERRVTGRIYALAAAADPTVQASTSEVEEQYEQELKRFGSDATLEEFYGLSSEDVRSLLAVSIAAKRLRQKHVIGEIEITPAEKEEYYERHRKDMFTIPPQVSVQALFRFAASEVERASEEQKIEEIRAELEEALAGVNEKQKRMRVLSNFIRAYSEHEPTRISGGLWIIYGGHKIQKEFWKFEDSAFEAAVRELSPVVAVDRGYCVFLVDSKRPSRQQTYAEVESQIERILWKEQFEQLQERWMESLREECGVEVDEDALMWGVEKEESPEATSALPGRGTGAGY